MIRYAVLTLGLSYASLWFVSLGGDPFRIAALILMAGGLALVVCDVVAPTEDPDTAALRRQLAALRAEVETLRGTQPADEPVEDLAVGRIAAGTIAATLIPAPRVEVACAGCMSGALVDGCELHADLLAEDAWLRERALPLHPYLDPNTTGPIPIVQPLDLAEEARSVVVTAQDLTVNEPDPVAAALAARQVAWFEEPPAEARHRAHGS